MIDHVNNQIAEDLSTIAEELKQLTAAVKEHNELLKNCIYQPSNEKPGRIVIGICSPVEVLRL